MAPFVRGLGLDLDITPDIKLGIDLGLNVPHAHSLVFIAGSGDLYETGRLLAAKGGIREQRLPSSLRLCLQGGH
jgi:hypothetical protein